MPNCPICGEEIDSLRYWEKEIATADFTYNEHFKYDEYSNWEHVELDRAEPNYCCPECAEILFNNEEEAKEFLKSGALPKERIPYFMERKLSQ